MYGVRWSSQPVGLALDGLEQFMLENAFGGVERDADPLTACAGHGKCRVVR